MSEFAIREAGDGVTFTVKIVPRAGRDGVAGIEGEALKVRVKAPPVEGRANEALVSFLAGLLRVPKSDVEIVRGATARIKTVQVRGVRAAQVRAALGTGE